MIYKEARLFVNDEVKDHSCLLNLRDKIKNILKFFFCYRASFRFVINRSKKNLRFDNFYIGNYTRPARFSFPLRGNGQADLMKVIGKGCALFWISGETGNKFSQIRF